MKRSYIILLVVVLMGLLIGCTPKKSAPTIKKVTEVVKLSFSEEYKRVPEDHPFKEIDVYAALDYFDKNQTGIIFIGFPKCVKCQQVVAPLATAAMNHKVLEIGYLNAYEMRLNHTLDYQKLLTKLDSILGYDEEGKKILTMPLTLFIKKGVIVSHYQGSLPLASSTNTVLDEPMTNELITNFDNNIKNLYNLGL